MAGGSRRADTNAFDRHRINLFVSLFDVESDIALAAKLRFGTVHANYVKLKSCS